MTPLAALALTFATATGPMTSSPSHGSSVVPAAATTTTPAPPVGVVVTITQNPDDCTLTAHVHNQTGVVGMLSRTDNAGNQPPWNFSPGKQVDLPVLRTVWSARIDWPNGTSTPVGQKALSPICIGTAVAVVRNPDGTTTTLVRQADTKRGWGWRL